MNVTYFLWHWYVRVRRRKCAQKQNIRTSVIIGFCREEDLLTAALDETECWEQGNPPRHINAIIRTEQITARYTSCELEIGTRSLHYSSLQTLISDHRRWEFRDSEINESFLHEISRTDLVTHLLGFISIIPNDTPHPTHYWTHTVSQRLT